MLPIITVCLYIQMNDNIPILKKKEKLSTCSHYVTTTHSMMSSTRKIISAYNSYVKLRTEFLLLAIISLGSIINMMGCL